MWQSAVQILKAAGPLLLLAAKVLEECEKSNSSQNICPSCGSVKHENSEVKEGEVISFSGDYCQSEI